MASGKLIFSKFMESPPTPKKVSKPRKRKEKRIPQDTIASRSNTNIVNDESPRPSYDFRFMSNDDDNADARSLVESEIVETTGLDTDDAATPSEDDEGAIILDPNTSDRQYFRDPHTNLQREVWRPGDGEGERYADYHDKPGPPAPLEKRWRFYQSRTGPGPVKHEVNLPPKYVILDDRAAYEVYASDIPRAHIVQWWPHDFSGNGKVRARRPHRGRGAIGDPDAAGNNKYNFGHVGKANRYYFTGQTDYKPIIYRSPDDDSLNRPQNGGKRRASSPPGEFDIRGRKIHRHNQFTPKDQLVKNGGAPHFGESWKRYKPKINKFLTRDARQESAFDKERLYGQEPKHPIRGTFDATLALPDILVDEELAAITGNDESMWIETEQTRLAKKRKEALENTPVDPGDLEHIHDSDDRKTAIDGHLRTNDNGSMEPATLEPVTAQSGRKKLSLRQDYFQRVLAEQEDAGHADATKEAPQTTTHVDSGTYASQLENALAEARKTSEGQKAEIDGLKVAQGLAQEKMRELEAEIAIFRTGLSRAKQGGDDVADD